MKVAVDMLSLGYGGSETYAREVLPRLCRSSHEFVVFLVEGAAEKLRAALPSSTQVVDVPRSMGNPLTRQFYQKYVLPKVLDEQGVDTLFVPGGMSGTRGRHHRFRVVRMLRNMLPFERSQWSLFPFCHNPYTRTRIWLLSRELIRRFRAADRMIFISEYSRNRVLPLLDAVSNVVIPHGISATAQAAEAVSVSGFNIDKPYLLYVSILDPYKRQLEVIEGFRRLKETHPEFQDRSLVLAGPVMGHYGQQVLDAAANTSGVVCTGALPPAEVAALRKQAELLLFASTCETCPNILLEYLSAGRPIICSDVDPMPEFGRDAAEYVDPTDPAAWCEAIAGLLKSPRRQEELVRNASEQANRFSWAATAEQTLAALTEW